MTLGARSALNNLYQDFGETIEFVSVYVREAHPGENYPHHTSQEQKMEQARDWVKEDKVPWTVAVDDLDGPAHNDYGPLPNSVYLIDSNRRVVFRAVWAGHERLLRKKMEAFLEKRGEETVVNLGQQENLVVPMARGAKEFDKALSRAGEKAREDFRREMGEFVYGALKLVSMVTP